MAVPTSVNHKWFINLNAYRYITPRLDAIHDKHKQTNNTTQKVSEYDQEIPQLHTADQPTAP